MKNNKVIFHIDFDSYFVSAHRSIDSSLKNKPVAISYRPGRSICSSISYELKRKNIKVGWPKFMVEKKVPQTIFVEPKFELYISLSNDIFEYIAQKYTKNIEIFSIDECWLDATEITENKDPVILAKQIQREINNIFDIPISIGISTTKWLAKMTTSLAKPYGVKFTKTIEDVKRDIWPLPIDEYFGIGNETARKLKKIGIKTIQNLATSKELDPELYKIYRKRTKNFIDEPNGEGEDNLTYNHNDLKGIGNEITFSGYSLDIRKDIYSTIKKLAKKVSRRAINRNSLGSVLVLTIRSEQGKWSNKQTKLDPASNDEEVIYNKAIDIFERTWNEKPIKGVGIRLNGLINEFDYFRQLTIFENDNEEDSLEEKTNIIIKMVNSKMRKKVLKTGYEFEREKVKEGIQSRFIPDDAKKGE